MITLEQKVANKKKYEEMLKSLSLKTQVASSHINNYGWVIRDNNTNLYYCGLDKWSEDLSKATVFHKYSSLEVILVSYDYMDLYIEVLTITKSIRSNY